MNIVFKTASVLLPLVAMALFGAPAAAETVSGKVHYGDLDLASPAGVTTLERRVSRVAKRICGGYDWADFRAMQDVKRCRSQAMASARPQMALATAEARQRLAAAATGPDVATSR